MLLRTNIKWDGQVACTFRPPRVLSFDLDEQAKQRIAETTKEGPDGWEIRGNTLHGCLEQFLLGVADLNPGDFTDWWDAA